MEKVICYCHKFLFYSNRFDPETLLEETMMALDYAVRSGKALYVEISNYTAAQTKETTEILKQLETPCFIHQVKYSMFAWQPEAGLLDVLEDKGVGCVAFSPLAQMALAWLLKENRINSVLTRKKNNLFLILKKNEKLPFKRDLRKIRMLF
ncbi:hypothetical protein EKM01_11770 [Flavobacterium sp. RSP46]|nr:hypothetical protein EKM01_11770 [Flavobacterium sp. RSP46]